MPRPDKGSDYTATEIFSSMEIPSNTPFFVRLDGWRFRKISQQLNVEKPFDERFAKCIVEACKVFFRINLNPALIYSASDEVNVLFLHAFPFRRRVEKTDSVLAAVISSEFSLSIQKVFHKDVVVAFDARVVVVSNENILGYLAWRQMNAWRNHNNAYAYWLYRKLGYKPAEAAKIVKGLKAREIHEILFKQGINLAKTPTWQRRGVLIYKEPYYKQIKQQTILRWRITENWTLPRFSTEEGKTLIKQILTQRVEQYKIGRRP